MGVLMSKYKRVWIWNAIRKKCVYLYETNDIDTAFDYIKNLKVSQNLKNGLKGEIIFFDKYYNELKLEALLDAGIKADFAGIENGKMVNFDVTTNLNYKNAEDYFEIMQKKKKLYSIALVNLKSEDIDIFPLKFPICPECGKYSHYILYRFPKEEEEDQISYISDKQEIHHYCMECSYRNSVHSFSNIFKDYYSLFDILENEISPDETTKATKKEKLSIIHSHLKDEVQIYEKESGLLISALADIGYNTHVGFWAAYPYWSHPLVNYIEDELMI